jgi:pimeloyl-ACP methyl ester carboxylesterase
MFHSTAWREKLAARPGNRVIGLPTGHWVMVQRPQEFNDAVLAWLAETDGAGR